MSYENGCNIGNVPDCPECEALEEEIERMRPELAALRLQAKMMFTIDEVEAWLYDAPVCIGLSSAKVIDRLRLHLRGPKHGLAAHARKEDV